MSNTKINTILNITLLVFVVTLILLVIVSAIYHTQYLETSNLEEKAMKLQKRNSLLIATGVFAGLSLFIVVLKFKSKKSSQDNNSFPQGAPVIVGSGIGIGIGPGSGSGSGSGSQRPDVAPPGPVSQRRQDVAPPGPVSQRRSDVAPVPSTGQRSQRLTNAPPVPLLTPELQQGANAPRVSARSSTEPGSQRRADAAPTFVDTSLQSARTSSTGTGVASKRTSTTVKDTSGNEYLLTPVNQPQGEVVEIIDDDGDDDIIAYTVRGNKTASTPEDQAQILENFQRNYTNLNVIDLTDVGGSQGSSAVQSKAVGFDLSENANTIAEEITLDNNKRATKFSICCKQANDGTLGTTEVYVFNPPAGFKVSKSNRVTEEATPNKNKILGRDKQNSKTITDIVRTVGYVEKDGRTIHIPILHKEGNKTEFYVQRPDSLGSIGEGENSVIQIDPNFKASQAFIDNYTTQKKKDNSITISRK